MNKVHLLRENEAESLLRKTPTSAASPEHGIGKVVVCHGLPQCMVSFPGPPVWLCLRTGPRSGRLRLALRIEPGVPAGSSALTPASASGPDAPVGWLVLARAGLPCRRPGVRASSYQFGGDEPGKPGAGMAGSDREPPEVAVNRQEAGRGGRPGMRNGRLAGASGRRQ